MDNQTALFAALIGGILVFSLTNRQSVPDVIVNPPFIPTVDHKEVELQDTNKMEITEVDKDHLKKVSFEQGAMDAQVQMRQKYMIDECRKMVGMVNYFDDFFTRPETYGRVTTYAMGAKYPEELERLRLVRGYLLNRDNEFKNLWSQIQTETGETSWLRTNQWILRLPSELLARIDSYQVGNDVLFNEDLVSSITGMNMITTAQQLGALYKSLGSDMVANFQALSQQQIELLNNQSIMMEVDDENDGRWLLPMGDDPENRRWGRVDTLARRNKYGVMVAVRTQKEMVGSPEAIEMSQSGQYPYSGIPRGNYTGQTGYGYDTVPQSRLDDDFRSDYGTQTSLLNDPRNDLVGQKNSYINGSGMDRAALNDIIYGAADDDLDDIRDRPRGPIGNNLTGDEFTVAKASRTKTEPTKTSFQKAFQPQAKAPSPPATVSMTKTLTNKAAKAPMQTQRSTEYAESNPFEQANVDALHTMRPGSSVVVRDE